MANPMLLFFLAVKISIMQNQSHFFYRHPLLFRLLQCLPNVLVAIISRNLLFFSYPYRYHLMRFRRYIIVFPMMIQYRSALGYNPLLWENNQNESAMLRY